VLFIGLGMAIGSDGMGWIDFADYELARTIGVIALALILFEGGLSVGFAKLRPVLGASLALAIPGTLLTAAISGLAASWLFGLSLLEGMLLGAIVSTTDGAAIFGLLRQSRLRQRVARALEGEAGLNDPVAVLLVVGLIDWIQLPDYGLGDMVLLLVKQLAIGLVIGSAVGWLAVQGLRRAWLGSEAAYAIGTIGAAAVAFGAASSLDGSGFLAVYLAGLSLGSVPIPAERAVNWRVRLPPFSALPRLGSRSASGRCSPGPGCGARCRSFWRPSRLSMAFQAASTSSTSSFSRCSSQPSSRERPSNRSPRRSG
jgi:cell volume regulation protein A